MSSATKGFRTLNTSISPSGSGTRTSGGGGSDGNSGGDVSAGGDTETSEAAAASDPGGLEPGPKGNSKLGADKCTDPWDVGLPPLIPPFRFACVEDGIYRGAHPSLLNLRFLTRLQLRTVISLLPPSEVDTPSRDLVEFCAEYGITHDVYSLTKYNDGFSHTVEFVSELLTHLLNAEKHPIFIHCMDGRQNTGIVVMCLRKLQNWGLKAIVDEFARYTKDSSFEYGEQNFVQRFDAHVELPQRVPVWFLHRVQLVSAPSIAPQDSVDVNSMSQ